MLDFIYPIDYSIFMITAFPKKYFLRKDNPSNTSLPTVLPAFREPLRNFILSLPHQAKVLDAGCGGGKVSYLIRTYRPDIEIYANDISDVEQYLPKGVKFTRVSIESLDQSYPPSFFDAVISLHVIEHLLYPMNMIQSIRDTLKPQGKLFIETPNWTRLFMPFPPGQFFWDDYTHIRPYSKFSLRKLLEEYEFSLIDTHELISTTLTIHPSPSIKQVQARTMIFHQNPITLFKKIIRRLILRFVPDVLIAIATK